MTIIHSFYAALLAFFLTTVLCLILIPRLIRLKFGQNIRADGPEGHLKKAGTPTMGGIAIIIGFTAAAFFFLYDHEDIAVLLVTAAFGLVGFIDDYIKTVKKRSLGLNVTQKIIGQVLVTVCFTVYVFYNSSSFIQVPFIRGSIDLGFWYLPLAVFVMLGGVNAVNLTDGLDGLCSGVTVIVAVFFLLTTPFTTVAGAMVGSLLGFLIFNSHPARVFMGDTGSLAIGGFVTSVAILSGLPVFLGLVGIIYVIEALSVIIQVSYFKATGGKRVFKMAPIHHHFEKQGFAETKITSVFCIITAVAAMIGYLGFNV